MVKRGRDVLSSWYSPDGEWEMKFRYRPGNSCDRYWAKGQALLVELRRTVREQKILQFEKREDADHARSLL